MKLVPYLFFRGDCAPALEAYAALGLGSVRDIMRYRDGPPSERGSVTPDWVLNATFAGDGVEFMASDGDDSEPMKGVALTLVMSDLPRARSLFAALAEGGTVRMPLQPMFWGAEFGTLTDRFGVQWQINCDGG